MAQFVVSTLADEADGFYGSGDLSLREAISLANGFAGTDRASMTQAASGRAAAVHKHSNPRGS